MNTTIAGTEFRNIHDAAEHAAIEGGVAIFADSRVLVVTRAEARRLQTSGVQFSCLLNYEMPNGRFRLMTIPIND